jgi:carboxyl-terminal processing protease
MKYLALVLLCGCGAGSWEGGIHARMGHSEEGGLRVFAVPSDGPAARAGLEVGDVIVAIDGVEIEGMSPPQIGDQLRGPVGTRVELRVVRGGRTLTVAVERAPYLDDE